jgi:PAS domain S-box-containing protein
MSSVYNIGPYTIDLRSSELKDGKWIISLTPTQMKVLQLLVRARGRIVTKESFHAAIWEDRFVQDGSLTQIIFLLRKVLGRLPDGTEMIETVSKRGYRLAAGAMRKTAARDIDDVDLNRRLGLGGDEPYRLLVESIEDYAIYMLDCSGRVLTWNRGAEQNKGFGSDEVLGHHFSQFFVPEDVLARVPERELAMAAKAGRCSGEGWRIRKNGERFWASFALTALRSYKGKLLGFAKVVRDLTEHKRQQDALLRMEAKLRRERDRLRAAAESSMDALFICEAVRDTNGEIEDFVFTYLNHNVGKMISVPLDVLLGGKMCELLPVNVELGLFDAYKNVANTGAPFVIEFPVQDESIKSGWVRIQAVRFEEGVAITASDRTVRTPG